MFYFWPVSQQLILVLMWINCGVVWISHWHLFFAAILVSFVSTSFSAVAMAVLLAVQLSQVLGFMCARLRLNALKYDHFTTCAVFRTVRQISYCEPFKITLFHWVVKKYKNHRLWYQRFFFKYTIQLLLCYYNSYKFK